MKAQRGVSLVELMVAMIIGLFLVLGLGTMFYSMRQTFIARQGLSALQDSERMAMTFLSAGIQGAGYFPNALTGSTFAGTTTCSDGTVSPAGWTLFGCTGATANTDTLSVRFITPLAGTTNIQGCSAGLPANATVTDVFSVAGGNLVCNETVTTATATTGPTAIPLVGGIAGMSILYGVDTTGKGSVTQYQLASAVTSWGAVKTVKLNLIFNNPLVQNATVNLTRTVPYMNGL